MLIDWFTVAAQIVNFLILVVLLKIFLYDRIVKAMDEREQKIASRFEQAEKKERDAKQEQEKYRDKNSELEDKKDEILDKAKRRADEKREEMSERAREEVEEKKRQWLGSLESEREEFSHELAVKVSEQVMAISRKSLSELMDAEFESRVIERFLQKLDELEEGELLGKSSEELDEQGIRIKVESAFPVGDSDQGKIRKTITDKIGDHAEVSFEQSPEMIAGVELAVGGRRVGLSLAGYLSELEDKVMDGIDRRVGQNSDSGDRRQQAEGKEA